MGRDGWWGQVTMEENATTGGTVQLLTQYQAADCAHAHTHKKKMEQSEKTNHHKPLFISRYHLPFRSDTAEYFRFLCCNVKGLISNSGLFARQCREVPNTDGKKTALTIKVEPSCM